MRANYKLKAPDDMEATLEITMSLKSWRNLEQQLGDMHPSWLFAAKIREMIDKANQSLTVTHESE
jgi:hypothetical protein